MGTDGPPLSEREKKAYSALAKAMNEYQASTAWSIRVLRFFGIGYFQAAAWLYSVKCHRRRALCWCKALPIIAFAWVDYAVQRFRQAVLSLLDRLKW